MCGCSKPEEERVYPPTSARFGSEAGRNPFEELIIELKFTDSRLRLLLQALQDIKSKLATEEGKEKVVETLEAALKEIDEDFSQLRSLRGQLTDAATNEGETESMAYNKAQMTISDLNERLDAKEQLLNSLRANTEEQEDDQEVLNDFKKDVENIVDKCKEEIDDLADALQRVERFITTIQDLDRIFKTSFKNGSDFYQNKLSQARGLVAAVDK